MVPFSKYFYDTVQRKGCNELIHDGSCWDSLIWNFTRTITGCAAFVFPIALIPIAMRVKSLDREVFLRSFRNFIEYFLSSWIISAFGTTFICVFRHLLGRFNYIFVLGVPTFLSASISSHLIAERPCYYYAHGLSTIAFQISILRGDFYIFKILRNSRLALTFAFMIVNTLLMHGLRETKGGGFYWITKPPQQKTNYCEFYEPSPVMDRVSRNNSSQLKTCEHGDNCDTYIFNGIKTYSKLGLGLEITRSLIYNYSQILRKPWTIFGILYKRMKWNLVMFLVGYVGIYRFVSCWSNRRNVYVSEEVSKSDNKVASFLCGLAFYLYPDYSAFSHAAVTTIEIYWVLYYEKIKALFERVRIPIDKVKMTYVAFPIAFGYVTHIRAFQPWLAPSILKKLMHLTTNFKDADIYTRFHSHLFGLTPQFIL